MSRFTAEPHALLRPYVESYWGFVRDFSELQSFTITPDCFAELIFFVDPPSVRDASGVHQLSTCVVIPLLERPIQIVSTGIVRCVAARLYAWEAGAIVPESHGTRTWHDVSANFGAARVVTDALHRDAWTELAPILDRLLLERLVGARSAAATSAAAVRAFLGPPSAEAIRASTEDVASRHGVSRRQIERRVRMVSTLSPNQLKRLRRFQFVRDALWEHPETDLKALASEAGYADQAHMSRHFRRYAGTAPAAFRRECIRLRAFLETVDVAIVQDEAEKLG